MKSSVFSILESRIFQNLRTNYDMKVMISSLNKTSEFVRVLYLGPKFV